MPGKIIQVEPNAECKRLENLQVSLKIPIFSAKLVKIQLQIFEEFVYFPKKRVFAAVYGNSNGLQYRKAFF